MIELPPHPVVCFRPFAVPQAWHPCPQGCPSYLSPDSHYTHIIYLLSYYIGLRMVEWGWWLALSTVTGTAQVPLDMVHLQTMHISHRPSNHSLRSASDMMMIFFFSRLFFSVDVKSWWGFTHQLNPDFFFSQRIEMKVRFF